MARSERIRTLGWPAVSLPQGFPEKIIGSRVWSGQDVSSLQDFIVQLSDTDIGEIESALDYFKGKPPFVPLKSREAVLTYHLVRISPARCQGTRARLKEIVPAAIAWS